MERVRLATIEEVEKIKDEADLIPTSSVFALDTTKGPIFGVRRIVNELDPVFLPEGTDRRMKVVFARDMANGLWFQGVTEMYFNVDASDIEWQKNVEGFGAERTSKSPEFRYKLVLQKVVPNV